MGIDAQERRGLCEDIETQICTGRRLRQDRGKDCSDVSKAKEYQGFPETPRAKEKEMEPEREHGLDNTSTLCLQPPE